MSKAVCTPHSRLRLWHTKWLLTDAMWKIYIGSWLSERYTRHLAIRIGRWKHRMTGSIIEKSSIYWTRNTKCWATVTLAVYSPVRTTDTHIHKNVIITGTGKLWQITAPFYNCSDHRIFNFIFSLPQSGTFKWIFNVYFKT